VDSACLVLERKSGSELNGVQRTAFKKVVKRAFAQRRKMMFKLLKADWPEPALQRAFAEVGLSPGLRAEAVTLEQFIRLSGTLAATSGLA
jgi:16S rRNA A1518/A1519 N6-dimethyltransferase RsmA/KsgA/DIM1 with predicted DNA glycosylase/AP lyase activity